MKLSFYLFNESVQNFSDAVKPEKTEGQNPEFVQVNLLPSVPFDGIAFFQKNRPTPPKWLEFISPYVEIDDVEDIQNQTNSFLLLIRNQDRIFAVTTGFGFAAIDRSKLETNFGLRTTLNAIAPDKIKSIDARNIDLVTRQTKTYLNRNSELREFDFEAQDELLSRIAGQPRDDTIGRKMSGADSLAITYDADFNGLGDKCTELLNLYLSDKYKETFDFIDNVQVIKNQSETALLEQKLLRAIDRSDSNKLSLAEPTVENEEGIERYKIWHKRNSLEVEELTIASVFEFLRANSLQSSDFDPPVDLLRKIYVVGLDHDGRAVMKKHSLLEWIVFETKLNGDTFILSLRDWHKIAHNFLVQIERGIAGVAQWEHMLPDMRPGENEGDYNTRVAAENDDFALYDKKNAPIIGTSKAEVADLLWDKTHFLCVKKKTRSSTLSHLFAQGSVSATLFNDHKQYREFILENLPEGWTPGFDVDNPDKHEIVFVFAVSTSRDLNLPQDLPFFSKVNLLQHKRIIERMGFQVRFCQINVSES